MTRPLHQNAVHQNSPRKDAVDGIIAAWARERPDLPVEVMEVWSRVTRLARRLDRDRAKAFSQWDLEGWEFDVLAALRRSGEPYQLSPGQLSNRGLVRRLPHPKDGRGVIVELTDEGRDRVDGALAALLESEGRLFDSMDAQVVEQVGQGLRAVLARQEELD